jgi:hypothetical protein
MSRGCSCHEESRTIKVLTALSQGMDATIHKRKNHASTELFGSPFPPRLAWLLCLLQALGPMVQKKIASGRWPLGNLVTKQQ